MSIRLRLARLLCRNLVRPALGRAQDPGRERDRFRRLSRLFRHPSHLCFLDGPLPRVTCHPRHDDLAILYFHGGAYVTGSPETHLSITGRLARLTGRPVFAPRYPLAPEHPAPAAFEAAVAAHARLMRQVPARRIVLGGDSAGGGLALSLLSHLCREGLAPAGLFALSPWTDLALTGESLARNATRDDLLPVARIAEAARLVLGPLAPRDPRISPLYADFPDCPPVLIQVGLTEILLDDARRMAFRLGARLPNGRTARMSGRSSTAGFRKPGPPCARSPPLSISWPRASGSSPPRRHGRG